MRTTRSSLLRPLAVTSLSLLWLLIVAAGLRQVWRYDHWPGKAAAAPLQWPTNALVNHAPGGATLVMVVHPQCPCSRASLAELALLMARSQGQMRGTVVFERYAGVSEHWVHSDLWRQAAAIPGVKVVGDFQGTLSQRFGAQTSGQTYLYNGQGRLLFSGGLTGARGHEGDNDGLDATLAILRGHTPIQRRTPVYGCPLFPKTRAVEKDHVCRL